MMFRLETARNVMPESHGRPGMLELEGFEPSSLGSGSQPACRICEQGPLSLDDPLDGRGEAPGAVSMEAQGLHERQIHAGDDIPGQFPEGHLLEPDPNQLQAVTTIGRNS